MLTDTVQSIVGTKMEELKVPGNQEFDFKSYALDYVRDLIKDVKGGIPDRDKEMFIPLEKTGYNVVKLPSDYYEYISVGVQLGHYVKGLAKNSRISDHKVQPNNPPLVDPSNVNNLWYWGGFYGYGMTWATSGAIDAYGNGGDYGDFKIDPDKRILITSPTYRFKNIVLRYYPNCITPSEETVLHPWFIMPLKHWLNYWYYFYKNDSRWQVSKLEYEKSYYYALLSKYRTDIPTVVKTIERIRGYRHG
jgi:hypothetical protein